MLIQWSQGAPRSHQIQLAFMLLTSHSLNCLQRCDNWKLTDIQFESNQQFIPFIRRGFRGNTDSWIGIVALEEAFRSSCVACSLALGFPLHTRPPAGGLPSVGHFFWLGQLALGFPLHTRKPAGGFSSVGSSRDLHCVYQACLSHYLCRELRNLVKWKSICQRSNA